MKRPTRRTSLSDWWSRPEGARGETDDEEDAPDANSNREHEDTFSPTGKLTFSPTKRGIQSFCIGDDSDTQSLECSPRKRAAMTPGDNSLLGSPNSAQGANINTATMTILRGICADYFENNVAPILRYVQQTQEQIMGQLKEVVATVDMKANITDVTSSEEIEQVAARIASSRADDSKVAVQIRLEQLATAMNQKANANNVPTLAQLALKANSKDVPTSAQLADLSAMVERKADCANVPTSTQFAELASVVEQKADIANVPSLTSHEELGMRLQAAEQKNAALIQELQELKKMDTTRTSTEPADITRLKAVFAAAGLRADRQMKEIRQQMQQIRDQCLGQDVGERWPGRKLSDNGSMQSDNDSDKLSLGASATNSLARSLDPEEKADLKKMQTVVAAAGTAFSREFREIKKQMSEVRTELNSVRDQLDANRKGHKESSR